LTCEAVANSLRILKHPEKPEDLLQGLSFKKALPSFVIFSQMLFLSKMSNPLPA